MNTELKSFNIYHPVDGKINNDLKTEDVTYEYVGFVNAENFIRSFYASQSANPDYSKFSIRNTTFGDIITDGKDVIMVKHIGLKKLNSRLDLYQAIIKIEKTIQPFLKITDENINDLIDGI